jgi:taurine dioxygenase
VLNLSPRFAQYVVGMDRAESDDLLQFLSDHIWDSPAYYHQWRPDEMVLWDNWRMLHCVTPAPPDEVRIVQRTTLHGDYGHGRKLAAAA